MIIGLLAAGIMIAYAAIGIVTAAWLASSADSHEDRALSHVIGIFWPLLALTPFGWAGSKLFNTTTRFLKRPKLPKATAFDYGILVSEGHYFIAGLCSCGDTVTTSGRWCPKNAAATARKP